MKRFNRFSKHCFVDFLITTISIISECEPGSRNLTWDTALLLECHLGNSDSKLLDCTCSSGRGTFWHWGCWIHWRPSPALAWRSSLSTWGRNLRNRQDTIAELRVLGGAQMDGEGCLKAPQDSFPPWGGLLGRASSQKGSGGRKRQTPLVTEKTTSARQSRRKLKYEGH